MTVHTQYSETCETVELGTPKGLRKTVHISEVILFPRSILHNEYS